ncbi:HD domain-containing protein [Patescibacteria group bacterium]|nr:HD domain-containing protein [Patescibacteria group bacterium]
MSFLRAVTNFFFETGIHAKTPRSGFWYLGTGSQSLAEHTNRATFIGYALAHLAGADVSKVVQMCLFHDFAEGRTSDFNYVHQLYNTSDEDQALEDAIRDLPFAPAIREITHEYHERQSLESLLAKDADILEVILFLKEQADIGNPRALKWIPSAMPRLKTEVGKQLAEEILQTNSDGWWYQAQTSEWWMNRSRKHDGDQKKQS